MKFLRQINIQRRVIGAVMMRELYNRFGREGLGFLWLIVEPLIFALPVLLLWSMVREKYEHGIVMIGVFISGYLPILLFRHIGGSMISFIRTNVDLLYHRSISLMDIF